MKKEIIAIDADDVLTNTFPVFIKFLNKKFSTNFPNDIMEENGYNLNHIQINKFRRQEILNEFHDSPEYKKIEPVKGSVEAILKLSEKYELVIITARPDMLKEKTKNFIEKYFPKMFSGIHHTTILKERKFIKKSEICNKIGAKIIIEDHYKNALDCAEKGIKAIILDMPWNRNEDYSHSNIEHAKNWDEIIKILIPKL
jgi:uncharacterized HAD superfamily protein